MVENSLVDMKEHEHTYLKDIVKTIPSHCETTGDYLFLANIYTAINERLYFKLKQIRRNEYTWLSESVISECKERLDNVIGTEPGEIQSEHRFIHSSMEDEHAKIDLVLSQFFSDNTRFRFTAIVDLVTVTTVWELKCTSDISIDHKLQVLIYAWLWNMMDLPEKVFKILNIKTGEIYVLEYADFGDLTTIVIALLKGRHDELKTKTDDEFLRDCNHVISRNQ